MGRGGTVDLTGFARSIRRISDGAGRFALLAIDQRPPLFRLVKERRPDLPELEVWKEVGRLKRLVVEALGPSATGILLDPVYGHPALNLVPRQAGLLLTLEDHRYFEVGPGFRVNRIISGWSVSNAVRAGADAVKLLIWYRADAPDEVREHQRSLVRDAAKSAKALGRPLVLEVLVYSLPGEGEPLPSLVEESVEELADVELGVGLYKLPPLPGRMAHYTAMLPAPWVVLSGGWVYKRFSMFWRRPSRPGPGGFWPDGLSGFKPWRPIPILRPCAWAYWRPAGPFAKRLASCCSFHL